MTDIRNIRLVVSDMAGTCVHDGGEVEAAFRAALADHGIEASAAQISAVRGAAKREAIARLTAPKYGQDAARVEAVYASFKAYLQRVFTREAKPVPGAPEAFAWLKQRGIKLAFLRRMQPLGGPHKRGRNKQAHQLKTYSPTTAS